MTSRPVIIVSRGSKLALYQSNRVKGELGRLFPEKSFEIKIIKTKGDKILDVSLSKIGDKGLFTRELEHALLKHEGDLAVHSLKDMPTELPEGLKICGVLERGEVRDALVSINRKKLSELDESDVVATSSIRRKAQLLHYNRSLKITDIRGNVDTRLQKMAEGHCTAMIMAAAGLQRLGYGDRISEILSPAIMSPAVSQGAIAIETRENDPEIESLINEINHLPSFIAVSAERVFLKALEGGCQVPVGCFSESDEKVFKISGIVSDVDGSGLLKDSLEGPLEDAEKTAHLADGNYAEALLLIRENENAGQNLMRFQKLMRASLKFDPKAVLAWIDEVADAGRERQKNFLNYSLHIVRESLVLNYGDASLVKLGASEQEFVQKFSPFIHSSNTEQFIEELNKAHYHMERNANAKILFMDLAFKFNELLNLPKAG